MTWNITKKGSKSGLKMYLKRSKFSVINDGKFSKKNLEKWYKKEVLGILSTVRVFLKFGCWNCCYGKDGIQYDLVKVHWHMYRWCYNRLHEFASITFICHRFLHNWHYSRAGWIYVVQWRIFWIFQSYPMY